MVDAGGRVAKWFGLNPGAEYGPAKRWPAERFIEAANLIHARTGCAWMIFGGAADQVFQRIGVAGTHDVFERVQRMPEALALLEHFLAVGHQHVAPHLLQIEEMIEPQEAEKMQAGETVI